MLCVHCRTECRVKILITEDGEFYPPCPECHGHDWAVWAEEGDVATPEPDQPPEGTEVFEVELGMAEEFQEFLIDFNRRQGEYIMKQYALWREERAQNA